MKCCLLGYDPFSGSDICKNEWEEAVINGIFEIDEIEQMYKYKLINNEEFIYAKEYLEF